MEGPPLGPGGEDITWPDQVAPRGRKASSTRKIKPQTSNHIMIIKDLHSPNTWVGQNRQCHSRYRLFESFCWSGFHGFLLLFYRKRKSA